MMDAQCEPDGPCSCLCGAYILVAAMKLGKESEVVISKALLSFMSCMNISHGKPIILKDKEESLLFSVRYMMTAGLLQYCEPW